MNMQDAGSEIYRFLSLGLILLAVQQRLVRSER